MPPFGAGFPKGFGPGDSNWKDDLVMFALAIGMLIFTGVLLAIGDAIFK
jgi:hypothetical protein